MPSEITGSKSYYWQYLQGEDVPEALLSFNERALLDEYHQLVDELEAKDLKSFMFNQFVSLVAIFESNLQPYNLNAGVINTRQTIESRLREPQLIQQFVKPLSKLFQINDEVYGAAWTQDLSSGTADSGERN